MEQVQANRRRHASKSREIRSFEARLGEGVVDGVDSGC
jgi:hypothetical protein